METGQPLSVTAFSDGTCDVINAEGTVIAKTDSLELAHAIAGTPSLRVQVVKLLDFLDSVGYDGASGMRAELRRTMA